MPYDVTGAHDGKWDTQTFDGLGKAIHVAKANMDAGWKGVRIECPDNTVLKEGLIREMYDVVQSGGMNA